MQVMGVRIFASLVSPVVRHAQKDTTAGLQHLHEGSEQRYGIRHMFQCFKGNDEVYGTFRYIIEHIGQRAADEIYPVATVVTLRVIYRPVA